MITPTYLDYSLKALNIHSTRNELKAVLKELRDLAYTDIKLNVSTQEMIEEVLRLQSVHRDDNDTTVEEIEYAFYTDTVDPNNVDKTTVDQDTVEPVTSEFKVGEKVYVLKSTGQKVNGTVVGTGSISIRCKFDDGSYRCFCHDGTPMSGNNRNCLKHSYELIWL
jgi:coenzyme F420-reducing hydrogenase alpha subunit